MTHLSIARAKQLLGNREQREREDVEWLADRAEREQAGVRDWQTPEPVRRARTRTDAQDAVLEHEMREFAISITEALADEIGSVTGRIERQFTDEIARLKNEIVSLKAG